MSDAAGGAGAAAGGARGGSALIASAPQAQLTSRTAFANQVASWQEHIAQALAQRLPPAESEPTRLHAAMRYSVLNGGKRSRALLLFCTARAVGLTERQVEGAACAIELVHAYSRVHDALPAIDNEDARRGNPSCHRAYDEGTAVLVGDALQSLAFQVLASDEALPAEPRIRLRLIELLAEAIGASGNAGEQSSEVAARNASAPLADIDATYGGKTATLIPTSVLMAAACAPATEPRLQQALGAFAASVGRAYARRRVDRLHAETLEALRPFGRVADELRALTEWLLVSRD